MSVNATDSLTWSVFVWVLELQQNKTRPCSRLVGLTWYVAWSFTVIRSALIYYYGGHSKVHATGRQQLCVEHSRCHWYVSGLTLWLQLASQMGTLFILLPAALNWCFVPATVCINANICCTRQLCGDSCRCLFDCISLALIIVEHFNLLLLQVVHNLFFKRGPVPITVI